MDARRRRQERLAGIGLAALGVVVLVVAIVALQSPTKQSTAAGSTIPQASSPAAPSSHGSSRHSSPAASSTPPGSSDSAAAAKQPLVVLNNTTITGLARRASAEFEQGGWTVTDFASYQNDIISTCAYYDPSVPGAEAAAEALQTQFPQIRRVKAQFSQLSSYDSPIVVILTPDFQPS